LKILLFSCLITFLPLNGTAQIRDSLYGAQEIRYDETKGLEIPQFDQEVLENLKNDPSFDYSEEYTENWWDRFKNWLGEHWRNFWHWLLGDYRANSVVAFLLRLLPYFIILCIVVFVGWLFYKLDSDAIFFKSKETPEIFFSEEEEIIRKKNIQELIEAALSRREYRMAVRYSYLLALQKLTEAEIIIYGADKTNSEYIAEITSETLKSTFQKATDLYDHVWYGNFEVTEVDFRRAKPIFDSLKTQIPSSNA